MSGRKNNEKSSYPIVTRERASRFCHHSSFGFILLYSVHLCMINEPRFRNAKNKI